ncbi:putative protein TPRXL [Pistacia vera]|uniref:putative protein TPRXL n=1 Tax=Pistacia vera TaxID=55513 RepID=UPI0012632B95|nr:putative protein TPRXL [Pistacia vera]
MAQSQPPNHTPPAINYVASSTTIQDAAWYMDLGATNQVTLDFSQETTSSPYTGSEQLEVGNGELLSISHTGSDFPFHTSSNSTSTSTTVATSKSLPSVPVSSSWSIPTSVPLNILSGIFNLVCPTTRDQSEFQAKSLISPHLSSSSHLSPVCPTTRDYSEFPVRSSIIPLLSSASQLSPVATSSEHISPPTHSTVSISPNNSPPINSSPSLESILSPITLSPNKSYNIIPLVVSLPIADPTTHPAQDKSLNTHPMQTRSKTKSLQTALVSISSFDIKEPATVFEALFHPSWKAAMQAEFDAL